MDNYRCSCRQIYGICLPSALHWHRTDYQVSVAAEAVSQRCVGSGFEDRDLFSASIYHVMSLDRWVDAIQRIDSPEYIKIHLKVNECSLVAHELQQCKTLHR